MRRSKLYKSRAEKIDQSKVYALTEALEALKSAPGAKFDESVDLAIKLGIDPKQSDQNVRGAVPLPKGVGKDTRVAVVASGDAADQAKAAGADHVGMEDLVAKIKDGWLDFDVLVATPDAMKLVRPLGRVLGPRGLMPNPKTGTVTDDVESAVKMAKAGRVEFRNDKGGCVHAPIGRLSFPVEDLAENFSAVIKALLRARPATSKGVFIQKCALSATIGPSVAVDIKDFSKAAS
jgi:large subunit ribosomal protein L1